jgi:hypothetical protein
MPRIPGQDEYQSNGFGTLESDEYRCRIVSFEEHDVPLGQYNKDPERKNIWFKLEPLAYAADEEAELVDKDSGEPISPDKTLIFFYDPLHTGLVPQIAKSRKFLAAALNVPVEEPIEFEGYEDLVGKEVICEVIVKDGNNRIAAVRPIKVRRPRAAKKVDPIVEAAKATFDTEIESTSEDTEY